MFHKGHTRVKSIPYEDSVREALCFGWVDSLIKRLDDDRYARKFTPRHATSKWSDINRKRWVELKQAGLLTPGDLAAVPTGNTYAPPPAMPDLPTYIAQALKGNSKAWGLFQKLARPTGVTLRVGFIRPNDRKRGKIAFANRSLSWRLGKSWA